MFLVETTGCGSCNSQAVGEFAIVGGESVLHCQLLSLFLVVVFGNIFLDFDTVHVHGDGDALVDVFGVFVGSLVVFIAAGFFEFLNVTVAFSLGLIVFVLCFGLFMFFFVAKVGGNLLGIVGGLLAGGDLNWEVNQILFNFPVFLVESV